MDIQRLRQILNELNPIFWNPEIDRQLEASDYPNQFPIESAKYRYTIALGKLVPHPNFSPCNRKSAPYRQMIIESRSSEKKRFNKLLKKVEECLSSYDNAFGVLLGEFTSPFAKQVLLTHQNLIEKFAGITLDNYQSWTELLVCMSHKDFLADLANGKTEGVKKPKRWTVNLANEAIQPVIRKYGKTPNVLTARFLEKETGCPKSTLIKTKNWDVLQNIKRTFRNKQGKMQQKPVNLSDKTLSIAEQIQDGTVKLHTSHKKKNIEWDD